MANEITASGILAYADANGVKAELLTGAVQFNATTKVIHRGSQSIATSDTALQLGGVGTLGYVLLVNRDTTNFVSVKTATSGTIIAKLLPNGGFCLLYVGSGVTAPAAVADTAACVLDVLVLSA